MPVLAALTWQFTAENEVVSQPEQEFIPYFLRWWSSVESTHIPFVAVDDELLGMAWLALVARTPRPGPADRFDGDLQTVYVLPEHRNRGVGEGLVNTIL